MTKREELTSWDGGDEVKAPGMRRRAASASTGERARAAATASADSGERSGPTWKPTRVPGTDCASVRRRWEDEGSETDTAADPLGSPRGVREASTQADTTADATGVQAVGG